MVASSMAYMHQSAAAVIDKQFLCSGVAYQSLLSPSAFVDFIGCFGTFASTRKHSQLVTIW